jgi:hypothetical protein
VKRRPVGVETHEVDREPLRDVDAAVDGQGRAPVAVRRGAAAVGDEPAAAAQRRCDHDGRVLSHAHLHADERDLLRLWRRRIVIAGSGSGRLALIRDREAVLERWRERRVGRQRRVHEEDGGTARAERGTGPAGVRAQRPGERRPLEHLDRPVVEDRVDRRHGVDGDRRRHHVHQEELVCEMDASIRAEDRVGRRDRRRHQR